MKFKNFLPLTLLSYACTSAGLAHADEVVADDETLSEIVVNATRVANDRPAGTYASLATMLRYDPQTELQSRGLAEGQSDVAIQGGVFENTGFAIGAVTVMDPQTGHYMAGLPVDPAMLSSPDVRVGIDNAVAGFNSNIATVAYSLNQIQDGGDVLLGAGTDDLAFLSLRLANSTPFESGMELGSAVSIATSRGDGTLPNGDHEFDRINVHLQRVKGATQSDLVIGYQDKFYGWPGAYTGFATLPETDHTKTSLVLLNHRRDSAAGWWEVAAYYRNLDDDYDFDRTTEECCESGSFEHETTVYAIGLQGSARSGAIDWRYGGQVTSDELVRSTDLTNGLFTKRKYLRLSLVPSMTIDRSDGRTIDLRFGATVDASNRDSDAVSPLLGATFNSDTTNGSRYFGIEYAGSTQLPGYTALGSPPTGLFGGNPDLGREEARQLSLVAGSRSSSWNASGRVFYREDDDLVDWTYSTEVPFSRQANAVSLDVTGVELVASWFWEPVDLLLGYTFLDKESDYGQAAVDASYYALNYARHRATAALRYRVTDRLELRLDNEYRVQEDNPLRTSSETAYLASIALAWPPNDGQGFGFALVADNLTDSDYEFFPGTPAVGRQVSLSVSYDW